MPAPHPPLAASNLLERANFQGPIIAPKEKESSSVTEKHGWCMQPKGTDREGRSPALPSLLP